MQSSNSIQESEQVQQTKKCGTCERDIELAKFKMHEIGCARNNYKCQVCKEIVLKSEKEEHDKEAHVKVPCQHCKIELAKGELQKHEDTCFMQPKPCKYCEQIIKFVDYEQHSGYCGSKTKKCFTCGRNICFKDLDTHDFGGECQAFIEQDKFKEEQEERRKQDEKKRVLDEQRARVEKFEKKQREREEIYNKQFSMPNEEKPFDLPTKQVRLTKLVDKQQQQHSSQRQDRYPNEQIVPSMSQQQQVRPNHLPAGPSSQVSKAPTQLKPNILSSNPTPQLRQGSSQQNAYVQKPPSQQQQQVPSQQKKNPLDMQYQQQISSNLRSGSREGGAKPSSMNNQQPPSRQIPQQKEEVKYGVQTRHQAAAQQNMSKDKKSADAIPSHKNISAAGGKLPTQNILPKKRENQLVDFYPSKPNQEPLKQKQVRMDENEELIARLMQEEEDEMRAHQFQNNLYTGNNENIPSKHSKPQAQSNPNKDNMLPRQQQQFYDTKEWNFNAGADDFGNMDQANGDDEELQRAILESVKQGKKKEQSNVAGGANKESRKYRY